MTLRAHRFTSATLPAPVAARLAAAASDNPPLRRGDRGTGDRGAIRAVQQGLIDLDDPTISIAFGATGIFGSSTLDAVMRFQRRQNLIADGVIGSAMLKALDECHAPAVPSTAAAAAVGAAATGAPAAGPRGLSLHFGVNVVNPAAYNGWDGALGGCEPDANEMEKLAKSLGYSTKKFLSPQATSGALLGELASAAHTLRAGDILFLTYSGHGGQVPDTNNDEDADDVEGLDETWCLYDRQVIDDELFAAFAKFARGVRIIVLSDSCHSGTVVRGAEYDAVARALATDPDTDLKIKAYRSVPIELRREIYTTHRALYDGIQAIVEPVSAASVQSSVMLISGCQDDQLSGDTGFNGVFTSRMMRVWKNGTFAGAYRQFHDTIRRQMPSTQQPNLYMVGASNEGFLAQKPFSI